MHELPKAAPTKASAGLMEDQNNERPRGRPTLYTPEVAEAICTLLAEGKTLTRICRENLEFPADRTIRAWALDPQHPFSPQYTRARELGYHAMADHTVDASDGSVDDDGTLVPDDNITVARARLKVDTRKWLLSKALPKVYGDKITTEVTGKDGKDLVPPEPSSRDLARAVLDILRTAKVENPDAAG